jgi:hypothetical protein
MDGVQWCAAPTRGARAVLGTRRARSGPTGSGGMGVRRRHVRFRSPSAIREPARGAAARCCSTGGSAVGAGWLVRLALLYLAGYDVPILDPGMPGAWAARRHARRVGLRQGAADVATLVLPPWLLRLVTVVMVAPPQHIRAWPLPAAARDLHGRVHGAAALPVQPHHPGPGAA